MAGNAVFRALDLFATNSGPLRSLPLLRLLAANRVRFPAQFHNLHLESRENGS